MVVFDLQTHFRSHRSLCYNMFGFLFCRFPLFVWDSVNSETVQFSVLLMFITLRQKYKPQYFKIWRTHLNSEFQYLQHEVKIETFLRHDWMTRLFSEEDKVPEHWQGPPHINKVKQYKLCCPLSSVYSTIRTDSVCYFTLSMSDESVRIVLFSPKWHRAPLSLTVHEYQPHPVVSLGRNHFSPFLALYILSRSFCKILWRSVIWISIVTSDDVQHTWQLLYSSCRNLPHPPSLSVSSTVNRNRQASAASRSHITYRGRHAAPCREAHRETQRLYLPPTHWAAVCDTAAPGLRPRPSHCIRPVRSVCLAKNNQHHPAHTWNMNYGRQKEREGERARDIQVRVRPSSESFVP